MSPSPNSPYLNLVDTTWGSSAGALVAWWNNLEQLKQAIVLEWHALSQRFIDGSINQWRRRLQAVIQENGGHIEHKFN